MISFSLNFQFQAVKKQIDFSELIGFSFKNSFPTAALSFSLKKSMPLTSFLDGFASFKNSLSIYKKSEKHFFLKISFLLDSKKSQSPFFFSGFLIRFIEKKDRYLFYALDETVLLFSAFYSNFSFSSFLDLEMALLKKAIPLRFHLKGDDFFREQKIQSHNFYKKSLMEIFLDLSASLNFFFYIQDSFIFIIPKEVQPQDRLSRNRSLLSLKEEELESFFIFNPPQTDLAEDLYSKNRDDFFIKVRFNNDFYIHLYRVFEFHHQNKNYQAQLLDYQCFYHIQKGFSVALQGKLIRDYQQ